MQLDTLRMTHDDDHAANPIQIDAFKTKSQPSKLKKLTNAHLRSINACFKCRKQGHIARECLTKTDANSGNSDRQ